MRIRRPIGHGLLTVAVLGVVTSGLAVLALYRTIAVSNTLRLEHARDSNTEELARLTAATPDADAPPPNIIGMRGGVAGWRGWRRRCGRRRICKAGASWWQR